MKTGYWAMFYKFIIIKSSLYEVTFVITWFTSFDRKNIHFKSVSLWNLPFKYNCWKHGLYQFCLFKHSGLKLIKLLPYLFELFYSFYESKYMLLASLYTLSKKVVVINIMLTKPLGLTDIRMLSFQVMT